MQPEGQGVDESVEFSAAGAFPLCLAQEEVGADRYHFRLSLEKVDQHDCRDAEERPEAVEVGEDQVDGSLLVWMLALEGVSREAAGAEAFDAEESAGVWFFFCGVDAGGYVEFVEVFAAEGAGGGLEAWEVDAVELSAGGGVEANDAGAVAEGDPEVAVGVDGHAVRGGVDVCGGEGGAFVFEEAGCGGVVEGGDLASRGVNVVAGGGVLAPDDAVGVGHTGVGGVEGEVRVEPVECGVSCDFVQADGSGEVGDGGGFSGERVEGVDAVVASEEHAACGTGDDGAEAPDGVLHVPCLFFPGGGVEADEGVVFYIHVEECVFPPDWAFAPLGAVGSGDVDSFHGEAVVSAGVRGVERRRVC